MKKRDLYKILFLICFWEFCAIFITYYDATLLGFKSEVEGGEYDLPEFKAGLNSGAVTVAEVGEIKKELAYHGNVVLKGKEESVNIYAVNTS